MAQYTVNGKPATKAEYDEFQHLIYEKTHGLSGVPRTQQKMKPGHAAPPNKVPEPWNAAKYKAMFPEKRSSGEMSLHSMLAEARGSDYARPNRFEVHIFRPLGAHSSGGNVTNPAAGSTNHFDTRRISLRCESITLPFRALTTQEDTNIYGPTRETATGVSYAGDIDLTFQSHGDLTDRVFFEEWQKQVFDETSWNLNYQKDYISEIQIYLLDMQENRVYGVVLHEAYPKTINGIDVSQDGDGIIKTTVSMAFRWWQALDETRKHTSAQRGIYDAAARTNTDLTPIKKAAAIVGY